MRKKTRQKAVAKLKETYLEVTTEERPWQKKYKKLIVPVV